MQSGHLAADVAEAGPALRWCDDASARGTFGLAEFILTGNTVHDAPPSGHSYAALVALRLKLR
jgi:hypothetical protein